MKRALTSVNDNSSSGSSTTDSPPNTQTTFMTNTEAFRFAVSDPDRIKPLEWRQTTVGGENGYYIDEPQPKKLKTIPPKTSTPPRRDTYVDPVQRSLNRLPKTYKPFTLQKPKKKINPIVLAFESHDDDENANLLQDLSQSLKVFSKNLTNL